MTRTSTRSVAASLAGPFSRAALALGLGVTVGALALSAVRMPVPAPAAADSVPAAARTPEIAPVPAAASAPRADAAISGADTARSARVLLPDGVTAAAGAVVFTFDPARPGASRARLLADSDGRFPWPEATPLHVAAFVEGSGFAFADPASFDGDARAPRGVGVEIVLAPGSALRGVVTDALSRPAPYARISIAFEEPLRPFRVAALADGAGRFEIAGLPFGTARIAARTGDGGRAAAIASLRRVFLSPSRIAEVDLVAGAPRHEPSPSPEGPLAPPSESPSTPPFRRTLRGVAIDESGSPAPGVRVALEDESSGVWAETVTDAAGRFAFRTPPLLGRARVEALGAAFEGAVEEDAPPPGAALVLPLSRLGALRGRIDAALPLERGERILVLLEPESGDDPILLAEAAGEEFLAAGLRPGLYAVSLLARGRVVWHEPAANVAPGEETDLRVLVAEDVAGAEDERSLPAAEERPLGAD